MVNRNIMRLTVVDSMEIGEAAMYSAITLAAL